MKVPELKTLAVVGGKRRLVLSIPLPNSRIKVV